MARKVITTVELTDDLDGGKADQTVAFAWDGANYEIDLSKRNAVALTKALKPYLDSARRSQTARVRPAPAGRTKTRNDLPEVRSWAKSNGFQISDRGRIPATVIEAFDNK